MNPSQASGTIKFELNVPQVLALAYPYGKPVQSRFSGDQLMFTTTTGDKFYVEPYVQERFKAAGIEVGVPFEIVKAETFHGNRRVVDFNVRPLNGRGTPPPPLPPAPVPVAPTPPTRPVPTYAHPGPLPESGSIKPSTPPPSLLNGAGEDSKAILTRCYAGAIEVTLAAVEAARAKGLTFLPTHEGLQACAATLFIAETRRSA